MLLYMINKNGWAYNQKQKRAKKIRTWLMYWSSLIIVGVIMFPILWGIIAMWSGIDL